MNDLAKIRQALADAHIPALENDAVMLGDEGRRVWLAGLGDQIALRLGRNRFRGIDDLPRTLSAVKTDDPLLLLAHEPDIFPRVPSRVALTLAGHTQGGQIRGTAGPAGLRAFAIRRTLCVRSHHRGAPAHDRVGRARARLGVPPEIVRVDLGA